MHSATVVCGLIDIEGQASRGSCLPGFFQIYTPVSAAGARVIDRRNCLPMFISANLTFRAIVIFQDAADDIIGLIVEGQPLTSYARTGVERIK